MSKNPSAHTQPYRAGEGIFSAISVGAIFILIGVIYVATLPVSLWDEIVAFFGSFNILQVPGIGISLPAPISPADYTVLYRAVFQFCLGLGVLQVLLLGLRLLLHSPIGKTTETVGNLVFWFGATYLVFTFLNSATTLETWFMFWAAILAVIGASMIARALVLFARR
ncbi:MAG TPA: hypothetical protein VI864_05515 [Candidatus Bathyarchaeia archaeon]|nr:hypothetical protein [Candidatus Bathyarchaeia archaeon]